MNSRFPRQALLFSAICAAVAVPCALYPQSSHRSPQNTSQSAPDPSFVSPASRPQAAAAYESAKLQTYLYEAVGPYTVLKEAVVAGFHEARHNPPDWRGGLPGYGQRYASDFSINALNVSARYTFAEAADQNVFYHRCACIGVWPRLEHAVSSVVVGRNEITGRHVLAVPNILAPYAGPMTAVELWYPSRYGPKDAFRMGNFGLLSYTAGNISLEFLPGLLDNGKAARLIARLHLQNHRGVGDPQSAP